MVSSATSCFSLFSSFSLVVAPCFSVAHPLVTVPQGCPCSGMGCPQLQSSQSLSPPSMDACAATTSLSTLSPFCLSKSVFSHFSSCVPFFVCCPLTSLTYPSSAFSHVLVTYVLLHLLLCLFAAILWCLFPKHVCAELPQTHMLGSSFGGQWVFQHFWEICSHLQLAQRSSWSHPTQGSPPHSHVQIYIDIHQNRNQDKGRDNQHPSKGCRKASCSSVVPYSKLANVILKHTLCVPQKAMRATWHTSFHIFISLSINHSQWIIADSSYKDIYAWTSRGCSGCSAKLLWPVCIKLRLCKLLKAVCEWIMWIRGGKKAVRSVCLGSLNRRLQTDPLQETRAFPTAFGLHGQVLVAVRATGVAFVRRRGICPCVGQSQFQLPPKQTKCCPKLSPSATQVAPCW